MQTITNNFVDTYILQPADVLVVPKSSLGIVDHYGVYLRNYAAGRDEIVEADPVEGVRIIPAEQFFNEHPKINSIRKFNGDNQARTLAIARALSQIGQPYHLLNFN